MLDIAIPGAWVVVKSAVSKQIWGKGYECLSGIEKAYIQGYVGSVGRIERIDSDVHYPVVVCFEKVGKFNDVICRFAFEELDNYSQQ